MQGWLGRALQDERLVAVVSRSEPTRDLAERWIAGDNRADALRVAVDLDWKGLLVSLTCLSGASAPGARAEAVVEDYLQLCAALAGTPLSAPADLSVRLSDLGLGEHPVASVIERTAIIARAAEAVGVTLTVDAEEAESVPDRMRVHAALRADHPQLGVTIQALLRRSPGDIESLAVPGARIRLVKGAFRADRAISHSRRHEIDLAFVGCLRTLMESGCYPMIATHDPRLVYIARYLAHEQHREATDWELQMHHGIRDFEQRRLADIGERVRVYLPFGASWASYYLQRIDERPANIALLARSLLGRR